MLLYLCFLLYLLRRHPGSALTHTAIPYTPLFPSAAVPGQHRGRPPGGGGLDLDSAGGSADEPGEVRQGGAWASDWNERLTRWGCSWLPSGRVNTSSVREPNPWAIRSSSCRRRWRTSSAVVCASRRTDRFPRADFGSDTRRSYPLTSTSARCTAIRPAPRSTSSHRRPSTSPLRIPVLQSRTHMARSRSSATASMKRRAWGADHVAISWSLLRGGSTCAAGFRTSRPQRTASASAFRTI